jgi:uncharacterized protein YbjT (DUF2867 family)
MTKVVVTGGSGKAGSATIRDLLEHGYASISGIRRKVPCQLSKLT